MRIIHPNCKSVSVAGKTYVADDKGVIELPEEHAAPFLTPFHGFAVAEDTPADTAVDPQPAKPKRKPAPGSRTGINVGRVRDDKGRLLPRQKSLDLGDE
jgi:hypothetical protein